MIINDKQSGGILYKHEIDCILENAIYSKFYHGNISTALLTISKNANQQISIRLDSQSFDLKTKKWIHNSINVNSSQIDNIEFEVNNACLTIQDQLLVVSNFNELFYIDTTNGKRLAKKNFNENNSTVKYFQQNTSLFNEKKKLFYAVHNTNDLISLNSSNQIVYISFDKSTNKIQLITSTRLELQFKRLHLFKHCLCAYSDRTNELFVYNMNGKESFKSPVFTKQFNENNLQLACFSSDCDYLATIETPKLLSVFRLKDGKRIAHVPLYSDVYCISMSDHYVVIGMQDKRIISYLLVDPQRPDHKGRIECLDSRYKFNVLASIFK